MSARVNIDSFALTDLRFKKLGKALFGESETHAHDLALAKMIRVWHHCTERGTHTVTGEEAELLTDCEDFALQAANAGLMSYDEADSFYVNGAAERTGWLEEKRTAAKAGGIARSSQAVRDSSGKFKPAIQPPSSHPVQLASKQATSPTVTATATDTTLIQLTDSARAEPRRVYDFESLYKKYPRKEGKAKGIAICKAQVKSPEEFQALSLAVDRYQDHVKRNATDAKYIKHFSTFMASWRDWLEPDAGAAPSAAAEDIPAWKLKVMAEEARNAASRV